MMAMAMTTPTSSSTTSATRTITTRTTTTITATTTTRGSYYIGAIFDLDDLEIHDVCQKINVSAIHIGDVQ